jgi:uncharacterized protein with von Willebrand factor type A (vWA) domain
VRHEEKIRLAEYYTGGGTNFEIPLRIALENIEAKEPGWEEADIVLVTDGEYRCSPDFIKDYTERCQKAGIRTHAVLLDGGSSESLKSFCDQVMSIQSIRGEEAAKPLFSTLVGSHL